VSDVDHLRRVRALFDEALERDAGQRVAWVRDAAGDDATLRDEVLALLAAHDDPQATLAAPALPTRLADAVESRRTAATPDTVPTVGARLGDWELVRLIGEGGMGAVYEAHRADAQFRMRAAVKCVRSALASPSTLRRFRRERQILADLQHPHIATLLDGGVTPDGTPYLVMEYVDGAPITIWCDARRLSVAARLRLFLEVCDAVQHAHQRLIVHRDLKPANILVSEDGGVKLLDFGIAALLGDAADAPEHADDAALPPTRGDARVFTPEYAAPEQLRGERVSTATDVYALGVVLYELLTARRPFDLSGRSPIERERLVSTQEPTRPSAAVAQRAVAPPGMRGALIGDLDAIVLTALRKEPARRYGSADALARDVRAHLDGRPVLARPDTLGYRLGKFVRRRRLEVGAASLAVLSLLGGIVATTRESARAEAERGRAVAARDFLQAMLGAADPGELGRDVTVREVLDSAAVQADTLDAQPVLASEIRTTIGDTYVALGEYAKARTEYTRARALRDRAVPEGDRTTALLVSKLAGTYEFSGEFVAADSLFAEAAARLDRTTDADDPERATLLEARARMQSELGDVATMERLLREVLAVRRRVAPDDEQELSYTLNNLAFSVAEQGRFVEADSIHAEAVATTRRAFGVEHPLTATAIAAQAHVKEMRGELAASDSLYRTAIDMRRRLLGEEHPDYAFVLFQYAQSLVRRQSWPEALRLGREVLALRGRSLPEAHPAVHTSLQAVGMALAGLDSLDAAERYLRESLALRRTSLPPGHWLVASGESVLAAHLVRRGRYAEAEQLLLGAVPVLEAARGPESAVAQDTYGRLVQLYKAWGRPEAVSQWQARRTGDR
jgi:serine/threonine-protein kinase